MARKKSQKQARRASRSSRSKEAAPVVVHVSRNHLRRIAGVLIAMLGVLLALGLFNKAGIIGEGLEAGSRFLVGVGTYVMPLVLVAGGIWMIAVVDRRAPWRVWLGSLLATLSLPALAEVLINRFGGGGVVGQLIGGNLAKVLDVAGSIVILFVILGIAFSLLFPAVIARLWVWITKDRSSETEADRTVRVTGVGDEPVDMDISPEKKKEEGENPEEKKKTSQPTVTGIVNEKDTKKKGDVKKNDDLDIDTSSPLASDYTPPALSLLSQSKGKPSVGDIKEYAQVIEHTLANFGIEVSMDQISVGPAVTRYAMAPAQGTKLSKIKGLQNELALALAAHPLRIEAPIPGQSLVGVEIPNKTTSMVGLGSMLSEPEFTQTQKPLLVSLGKGVSGKPYFADIAKMPHMLIAGATGSGKSVTAHNIIISLLYQHGPEMLRFIMVDPKRVELTLYDKIPHLLTPVIKTPKKAILALAWATKEMDRRYDILEQHKVRDIGSYHETIVKPSYADDSIDEFDKPERMPYIVVIIDEMADLMQAYPRELEAQIVRLAQMSRAVGIHLVLSTQRPSVNVITGLIKANVPTRLALKVSSQVDSRTILDTAGAETLLGKGDMLYRGGEMSKPERIQCAFISEDEVKKVVSAVIKNNREYLPDEVDIPETIDASTTIAHGSLASDDGDELLPEARQIVVEAGKASTSYLQRKLRVGYSRAASLMDELEERGVIGPANGSKPREVLVESADNTEEPTGVPEELEDDLY